MAAKKAKKAGRPAMTGRSKGSIARPSKAARGKPAKADPKATIKPIKSAKPKGGRGVQPIPEGYHSITPYLIVDGAAKAIDYYVKAFGAKELMRMPMPNGRVGHAELQIGTSRIMLADEFPQMGARSPKSFGGTAVGLALYVPNVDQTFARAISLGGKEERPLQNQFYGDRSGTLVDPFGHKWTVATHVEDVPPEEMERRAAAMHEKHAEV